MQTLILDSGKVVAVGHVLPAPDGYHVDEEVWPLSVQLIERQAPGLGYRWNGAEFELLGDGAPIPPKPMPQSVPMRSARLALYAFGLLAQVEEFIAGMQGSDGDLARIDWATAQTVRRDSVLVVRMKALLQKSDAEIDELFVYADGLE